MAPAKPGPMAFSKPAPMAPKKPTRSFRPPRLNDVKKELFYSSPPSSNSKRVTFSKEVDVAPYGVRHYIGRNNGKLVWKIRTLQTPDAPRIIRIAERPNFFNLKPVCLF